MSDSIKNFTDVLVDRPAVIATTPRPFRRSQSINSPHLESSDTTVQPFHRSQSVHSPSRQQILSFVSESEEGGLTFSDSEEEESDGESEEPSELVSEVDGESDNNSKCSPVGKSDDSMESKLLLLLNEEQINSTVTPIRQNECSPMYNSDKTDSCDVGCNGRQNDTENGLSGETSLERTNSYRSTTHRHTMTSSIPQTKDNGTIFDSANTETFPVEAFQKVDDIEPPAYTTNNLPSPSEVNVAKVYDRNQLAEKLYLSKGKQQLISNSNIRTEICSPSTVKNPVHVDSEKNYTLDNGRSVNYALHLDNSESLPYESVLYKTTKENSPRILLESKRKELWKELKHAEEIVSPRTRYPPGRQKAASFAINSKTSPIMRDDQLTALMTSLRDKIYTLHKEKKNADGDSKTKLKKLERQRKRDKNIIEDQALKIESIQKDLEHLTVENDHLKTTLIEKNSTQNELEKNVSTLIEEKELSSFDVNNEAHDKIEALMNENIHLEEILHERNAIVENQKSEYELLEQEYLNEKNTYMQNIVDYEQELAISSERNSLLECQKQESSINLMLNFLKKKQKQSIWYSFRKWKVESIIQNENRKWRKTILVSRGIEKLSALFRYKENSITILRNAVTIWKIWSSKCSIRSEHEKNSQCLAELDQLKNKFLRRSVKLLLRGNRFFLSLGFQKLKLHANEKNMKSMKIVKMIKAIERSTTFSLLSYWAKWKSHIHIHALQQRNERISKKLVDFDEAKELIIALSKSNSKLNDCIDQKDIELENKEDELSISSYKLTLAKCGIIAMHLRQQDYLKLSHFFTRWQKFHTHISIRKMCSSKQIDFDSLIEEKNCEMKKLEELNENLKSEANRCRVLARDKAIATELVTKELLHEEERHERTKEEYEKLSTELQKLNAGKIAQNETAKRIDTAVGKLPNMFIDLEKEIFLEKVKDRFLDYVPDKVSSTSNGVPVITIAIFRRMIEENSSNDTSVSKILENFPFKSTRINLEEFVSGLMVCFEKVYCEENIDVMYEKIRAFWLKFTNTSKNSVGNHYQLSKSFQDFFTNDKREACQTNNNGNFESHASTSWVNTHGKLSEEVLQNQDKLLAVLEHETAIVERAVMDENKGRENANVSFNRDLSVSSSLYDELLSVASNSDSTTFDNLTAEANDGNCHITQYKRSDQTEDLLITYSSQLQLIFRHYSVKNGQSTNDVGNISLDSILKFCNDSTITPALVSSKDVELLFIQTSDSEQAIVHFDTFLLFLEQLASFLYRSSTVLSMREKLTKLFILLGIVRSKQSPCFVGIQIENALWSLFEYYASNYEKSSKCRKGLTSKKFCQFILEFSSYKKCDEASRRAQADIIFHKIVKKSLGLMNFDEFYAAIGKIQIENNPRFDYSTIEDALLDWVKQMKD